MKFLCVECDEPMKLERSAGPDEGSLTVTFGCPQCGWRVAMLTNPFETQLIRSLGVKVGGRAAPAAPFEQLRSSMAHQRSEAFADVATGDTGPAITGGRDESPGARPLETGEPIGPVPAPDDDPAPGCPFANMVASQESEGADGISWSPEAEARVERIPSFIRPMAKKAIERYAEGKGHRTITEAVMDEAKGALGM